MRDAFPIIGGLSLDEIEIFHITTTASTFPSAYISCLLLLFGSGHIFDRRLQANNGLPEVPPLKGPGRVFRAPIGASPRALDAQTTALRFVRGSRQRDTPPR
jgi:hypothetical protein